MDPEIYELFLCLHVLEGETENALVAIPEHFEIKQQSLCVGFLLTNRQFQEVGHCRRHIFGPILPKFYVEFENIDSSCDNLRPFRN